MTAIIRAVFPSLSGISNKFCLFVPSVRNVSISVRLSKNTALWKRSQFTGSSLKKKI